MGTKKVLELGLLSVILFICMSQSAASAQNLRFDPDPFIPLNEQFAVPLIFETGGLDIKGVEVTITFDPALVRLDSITPGAWYTGSGQDFFFWDYTIPYTYAIHFASAMLDGTNNIDDVLALCHFSFVDFGLCPLDFTLVDVRDVSNDPVTTTTDPGVIYLNAAVETVNVKFNSLKAIYR